MEIENRSLVIGAMLAVVASFVSAGCPSDSNTGGGAVDSQDTAERRVDAQDTSSDVAADTAERRVDVSDASSDSMEVADGDLGTDGDIGTDVGRSDAGDLGDGGDCAPCDSGTPRWAEVYGGSGFESGTDVATDASGDIYVTGRLGSESVSFGGADFDASESREIFLAKFDEDGGHLWSKMFGSGDDDDGTAVETTGDGNLYLAARGEGPVDFGGGSVGGSNRNLFLAKFEQDGSHVWSKAFEFATSAVFKDMAVDSKGGVTVAGSFRGGIDLGGGTLEAEDFGVGQTAMVLGHFDASGDHRWSESYDGGGAESVWGIARGSSDDLYFVGYFDRTFSIGGNDFSGSGGGGTVIAKLRADGSHVWSTAPTASDGYVEGLGIDVDARDRLYVAGTFYDIGQFGDTTLNSRGGTDAFVASYEPTGAFRWAKAFGDKGTDVAQGIAVTDGGEAYVTGWFESTWVAEAITLTSAGDYDVHATKLDASGGEEKGRAIAIGDAGKAFATGSTNGTFTFAGRQRTAADVRDILLFSVDR